VEAFTDLVRNYRERLLRFLITRCTSVADAEDALQDTLINAYRYLDTYDPRWRFSTWLYRIAIRNAGKLRDNDHLDVAVLGDLHDEENDPMLHCIAASEKENLWIAARRLLNEDVFTAMWLRYAEDMSVNDISKTLDRSASWTKVNLMRGRRALETQLNDTAARSEAYG
jgi:RNA polymerase sigma-70 factor (ECF subfamily)